MTEFAATLGRIGLTNLDKQNAERIWAAEYLQKKLSGLAWVKVRMPQVNEKSVYHAVALELKIEDDKSVKILEELVSCGVPMRKLFSPLNRHPHFSSARRPARGYPWLDSDYKGVMKGVSYENLDLPITYKFCYGKILELYTHPGITKKHLDAFAKKLVSVYSNY
jgi:dTDP-4-amino-4,6-dideoxygalactose transaminase